jgi:hypothetical protein
MWRTATGEESRKCSAKTRGGRGAADEDEVRRPRSVAGQIQQRRGGGVECRGSTVGTREWNADASEWRGRV